MRDKVILVDENDNELGIMDKMLAHQKGLLHRAFSIFIFNDNKELLVQQRAFDKYHGGGLWTNSCCSHPQLGEDVLLSAQERLLYEMGIQCDLKLNHTFQYKIQVENNLWEHELDYVYIGYFNKNPKINPLEVHNYRWSNLDDLMLDIVNNAETYTSWFKLILPKLYLEYNKKG